MNTRRRPKKMKDKLMWNRWNTFKFFSLSALCIILWLFDSSVYVTEGALSRFLNGQVPATSIINDDADEMFNRSPIHRIDMRYWPSFFKSWVYKSSRKKNPKENLHPAMCSSSLELVMCIVSCIFIAEYRICTVHDCNVLCLDVV